RARSPWCCSSSSAGRRTSRATSKGQSPRGPGSSYHRPCTSAQETRPRRDSPMRRYLPALVALLVLPLVAAADEPKKDSPKSDPPGVPVEARLVATKATYKLDLGGKSAEEFRKLIADAEKTGRYPEPPAVELVLELKNTGDKDVQVWIGGDAVKLMLELKGPAAENVPLKGKAFTSDFRLPKPTTLKPGKTHEIKIAKLTY